MLETILRLYAMAMAADVRSPVPHLFGPPGCGKSTVVEQAAEIIGCQIHTINVSRISPLELEGVQMPVAHETEGQKLQLLHATFWTQLQHGDILLLDEFLRGFPEVYNGLLDILTSRRVGGYPLPPVFIIAASNTTVAYDKALEDRLLHLPVPDPRNSKSRRKQMAQLIIDQLGLHPQMVDSMEMNSLLDVEVMPMYEVLDDLKKKSSAPSTLKGNSIRKLIGQAQLREVQSSALKELISMNNVMSNNDGKTQYMFLLSGRDASGFPRYEGQALALRGNDKLTPVQALNLELNLQLIEMERIRKEKGVSDDDDILNVDDQDPFI